MKDWNRGLNSLAAVVENQRWPCSAQMVRDAADEIERLTADLSTARQSLVEMASQRNGAVAEIERWQKAGRDAVTMSQPDKSTSASVRWIPKWVLHNISKLLPEPASTQRSSDPDITKCPNCKGPADNGHDRCSPPNPYFCSKCEKVANL